MTRARSGNARAPYYRQLAHANPQRQNSLTNGFTKRGLISKKVPAPIVRIAHASIAMLWESMKRRSIRSSSARIGNTIAGPRTCVRIISSTLSPERGVRPNLIAYRGRFDGFHRQQSLGVEDAPDAVRQQQMLRKRQRRRSSSQCPRLRRSDRCPPACRDGCG
jgi:hypothetical protein